jgi:hypothetical protein
MSDAQPSPKKFDLNLVQVLDLGCGIMHQAFFKQPADKAKSLLKDLKNGKGISLGAITLTNKNAEGEALATLEVPLSLRLDYSEFKGGGFGFPVFEAALKAMLTQIGEAFRAQKDLNILTNEQTGSALVHQPGVVQVAGQFNVLVVCIERGKKNDLVFKLMFVDPEQYDQLRREPKQATEA